LLEDVKSLFRRDRNSVRFLIASALYRDGLTAVFAFGAILAVSVYGMAQDTVLIFGVVANVVAALGSLFLGRIEDRVGPKLIIMISLIGLVSTCLILLFARGTTMFWVFGLILCLWVGPAQSSSRSFLAQVAPAGSRGRDVRPVRHHRAGRLVPGPGTFRALLRVVLRSHRYRGDRARARRRHAGPDRGEIPAQTISTHVCRLRGVGHAEEQSPGSKS
jgi:hypothetical protein